MCTVRHRDCVCVLCCMHVAKRSRSDVAEDSNFYVFQGPAYEQLQLTINKCIRLFITSTKGSKKNLPKNIRMAQIS